MCKKAKTIMGKIKKLFDIDFVNGKTEEEVYPVTHVKGVFDDNNNNLQTILYEINNSINKINSAIEKLPKEESYNNLSKELNTLKANFNSLEGEIETIKASIIEPPAPLNSVILSTNLGNFPVSNSENSTGMNIIPFFQKGYKKDVFSPILEMSDDNSKHIILPFDKYHIEGNIRLSNEVGITGTYEGDGGDLIVKKSLIFCNIEGFAIKEYGFDGENYVVDEVFIDGIIDNVPDDCAYVIINVDKYNYPEIKLSNPLGLPLSHIYFPNYMLGLSESLLNYHP